MKDIYLMNRETGEILPSEQVFKEFYKTHGIKESVFDEWTETDIEVEGSEIIANPTAMFIKSIRI